jgi:tetratricopeptide (TPR) repeat protein
MVRGLSIALLALSSLIAYTLASEPATQGTQASAAGAHDNPRQSDPVQELWRLRSEGNSHFESGVGLKKALAAFEAALALQPSSAIELFNLGTTQRKLGTLDQAVQTLLEAIRADKSLAQPYYTLGLIYRSKGDARQAQQYFEQARRLAPGESACYYQLGRLYRENGRAEDALQAFIDALQLNPSHTGALYQLHLYYQEHGAAEEAKRTFEEFSRIKRALTTSRRESNDDESELSHPILGSPPESAPASSDHGHVDLELVKEPLARDVVAFDVNDLDGDGLDDLVIVDRAATVRILMNRGGGKFEATRVASLPTPIHVRSVSLQILARGESFRIVVGAREGVLVSDADSAAPQRTFKSVSSVDASGGLAFVDLDHDGDVDIVVGRFDTVLINEGNATFQENSYLDTRAREAIRGGAGRLTFADFDGLNAMDAVVYTSAGHPQLLEDALGGKHILAAKNPLPASGRVGWSNAADVDGDGRLDLVTLTDGGMTLYYNEGRRQFKSATVTGRRLGGQTWAAAVADLDNDGRPDVLVLGSQGSFVWRNMGGRRFSLEPVSPSIKPDPSADPVIADLDNDGRRDVVVLQGSGELSWLRNTSPHVGGMVTIKLKGLRSAPTGLHAEIEVRRGTFYTKTIADGRPLSVSLGDGDYAEVVRITWADGFVESKFRVEGGKTWSFPESERVSGSCPSVFAWDGRGFHFISDAFISGPMGVPMRPGQYFPPDHDEYLRIPGDSLRADHGRLRIAVTEELREAVYLDQVKLFAVDHPAEVEVYPNEYLMPGELPDFKLHVLSAARPPLAAHDQTGADVLDLIRAADQRYPANFRRLPYDGFAEPQGVEFLLPEGAARAASLRLLLTG